MIPKIIHYIWLGDKKLDNTSKLCINSCRRVCFDYEIKVWNEENLNLSNLIKENKFLKECVEKKLWAFASDYLRLYVLYRDGGIYLDTDVEVLNSFNDLLNNSFFVGMESGDYIGTGIIGAEQCSLEIKRLLDFYINEIWNVDYYNNPIIFKKLVETEPKTFEQSKILPIDYFSPYNPYKYDVKGALLGSDKTVCIHWYNASWGMTRKGYVFLNTKHIKNPILKIFQIIKKNIGFYRKRKKLNV